MLRAFPQTPFGVSLRETEGRRPSNPALRVAAYAYTTRSENQANMKRVLSIRPWNSPGGNARLRFVKRKSGGPKERPIDSPMKIPA